MQSRHVKSLDGLRGIAVLLVIAWHFLPRTDWINQLPNGLIGVDIFFVLSGFLISLSLFEARSKCTSAPEKRKATGQFFMRRVLRIFPIYYLTLLLLYLVPGHLNMTKPEGFGYYFTYTSNIYFFQQGSWSHPIIHLWSLAVEEQIYLLWPFALLFLPSRMMKYFFHACILIGIGIQYFVSLDNPLSMLTVTCLDAFGWGSLLAWYISSGSERLQHFRFLLYTLVPFCLFVMFFGKNTGYYLIPERASISILATAMISFLQDPERKAPSWTRQVFENTAIRFIGKISYGIYLYHLFVYEIVVKFSSKILSGFFNTYGSAFFWSYTVPAISFGILLLISWLSYQWIELPFLRLKKYFREVRVETGKLKLENGEVL